MGKYILYVTKMVDKIIKKGNCVRTKVGIGKVTRIDTRTYSIPIYRIKLTKGKHKGEQVAQIESELTKVRRC